MNELPNHVRHTTPQTPELIIRVAIDSQYEGVAHQVAEEVVRSLGSMVTAEPEIVVVLPSSELKIQEESTHMEMQPTVPLLKNALISSNEQAILESIMERITAHYNLTRREREVSFLATQGLSNREIGEELNLAEATVKQYVSSALVKMSCGSRSQMAAKLLGIVFCASTLHTFNAGMARRGAITPERAIVQSSQHQVSASHHVLPSAQTSGCSGNPVRATY